MDRMRCVAIVALFLVPAGETFAAIDLQLDPLKLTDENASVEFECTGRGIELGAEEADRPLDPCYSTPSFKVCLDARGIREGKFGGYFEYPFLVQPLTSSPPRAARFVFTATSRGAFFDRNAKLAFTVSDGSTVEFGTIFVPVHADKIPRHFLSVRQMSPLQRIKMGAGKTIALDLKNELPNLRLVVGDHLRVRVGRDELWNDPEVDLVGNEGSGVSLQAGQLAEGIVRVRARPASIKALGESIFPYRTPSSDQELDEGTSSDDHRGVHDRVSVEIPYRAEGGGKWHYYTASLPVRFVPSFWSLVASVVMGAMIGSAIATFAHGTRRPGWLRAFVAACLIAACAEAVALVLFEFDSRLRILGFDLDPYQILMVALLGVAVGLGGRRGADLLRFPQPAPRT